MGNVKCTRKVQYIYMQTHLDVQTQRMTWVGVGAELLVDWRSATGQAHGKLMGDF